MLKRSKGDLLLVTDPRIARIISLRFVYLTNFGAE